MTETSAVLRALLDHLQDGGRAALATIVRVEGSTYRREGARLFIPESGTPIGNLSGGCLEGEVEGAARLVITEGVPRVETYDLTADDEAVWGWGLGCNGLIEVLIEPAENAVQVADAMATAIENRTDLAVAVLVEDRGEHPAGARIVTGDDSSSFATQVSAALDERIATGDSGVAVIDGTRVFLEVLRPPLSLVICGAGHDAIPVARTATGMGWTVTVTDDREDLLTGERFPGCRLVATPPGEIVGAGGIDDRSYVLVMSHNYLRDKDYLAALEASDAAYVGMLGPAARLERLYSDLDMDRDGRVYGPAGLDIGAEGPDEIAVALVAEVMSVARSRKGAPLRDRSGSIHGSGS